MDNARSDDRRVRRTRLMIFDAFKELVLSKRYDDFRVADVIKRASVGRSTFYEHFRNKDDVLLSSLEPLFNVLAEVGAGRGVRGEVFFVLDHFWEQRSLARIIFAGPLYEKLTRKLADMIESRLGKKDQPARLIAAMRAGAILAAIRAWIGGEFSISADAFAGSLLEMA